MTLDEAVQAMLAAVEAFMFEAFGWEIASALEALQ